MYERGTHIVLVQFLDFLKQYLSDIRNFLWYVEGSDIEEEDDNEISELEIEKTYIFVQ